MKNTLTLALAVTGLVVTAISAQAEAENSTPDKVLGSSRFSWMTDGLDMQGGGTTWAEIMADKVTDRIESKWKMQQNVKETFRASLKDLNFRSAVDELSRQAAADQTTTWNMISYDMMNMITENSFRNFGALPAVVEKALSAELTKYGYMQRMYGGPMDARAAVIDLWRKASSPAEEKLRYSASYRYGID